MFSIFPFLSVLVGDPDPRKYFYIRQNDTDVDFSVDNKNNVQMYNNLYRPILQCREHINITRQLLTKTTAR